jgi:hypothetical protein
MIQPLRKIHRGMFFALFLTLPTVFASGLLSRHKAAREPVLAEIWSKSQIASLAGQKLHMRIVNGSGTRPGRRLELIPESPLLAPDVLVYWSKADAASNLPSGAILLGPFEPTKQYPLPEQEMKENGEGFIILYSLGWKQMLGSVAIGPVGGHP